MMKDLNVDTDTSSDESDNKGVTFNHSASPDKEGQMYPKTTSAAEEDMPHNKDNAQESPPNEVVEPVVTKADRENDVGPELEKVKRPPRVSIDDFNILKVLGRGAYGKVYQVRKISGPGSGHVYAMKAMNKARICGSKTDVRHTKTERNVLVSVNHPFIVNMHFAFETAKRLYLVQEFCCGGELFRRMEVERLMLEEVAQFYLREILLALEYLHKIDVVYRDLKTENVMLDKMGHVKLIDFGLSKTNMGNDSLTKTFCGTVEYMAPEVILRNGYGKPADWWSFGIFTFDLLTGRSPFHSNQGKQATKDRILKGKYNSPKIITPEATDFVRRLLRKNIDRRLGSRNGATELKCHMFFKDTDWDKVLQRDYEPPFLPCVRNDTDVQHFDEQFTSRTPRESNSVPRNHRQDKDDYEDPMCFDDFDFVSNEFLEQVADSDASGNAFASTSSAASRESSTSASVPCDCESLSLEASPLEQFTELRICSCGS